MENIIYDVIWIINLIGYSLIFCVERKWRFWKIISMFAIFIGLTYWVLRFLGQYY